MTTLCCNIKFAVAEIGFLKSWQTLLHWKNFVQQDIIYELFSKSFAASVSEEKSILQHPIREEYIAAPY